MSNIFNEMILENLFEDFLEAGFSEDEAEKLANEKMEEMGSPWG